MEGGADTFGSSTAPLAWHDFLERMRQPSASEFVKAIKGSAPPPLPFPPISLLGAYARFGFVAVEIWGGGLLQPCAVRVQSVHGLSVRDEPF